MDECIPVRKINGVLVQDLHTYPHSLQNVKILPKHVPQLDSPTS